MYIRSLSFLNNLKIIYSLAVTSENAVTAHKVPQILHANKGSYVYTVYLISKSYLIFLLSSYIHTYICKGVS